MERFLQKTQRAVVLVLLGLMITVVVLSTVELGVILVRQVLEPPRFLLDLSSLLQVFGFFLMVLIGIELLETLRVYLSETVVHVEIILLVAIIAISRKVIVIDPELLDPLKLVGIAAIILALSAGYFVVKKAGVGASPQ